MTVDAGRPSEQANSAGRDGEPDAHGSATAAQGAPGRYRKRAPGMQLDCHAGPDVEHVGMVFVHGIGSQAPGETLLDWGSAIIGALLDARMEHDASADPVIDSQLDPAPGQNRFIELQLPPVVGDDGTTMPEQHWVMTEAWWAQRVRPPSFGQMAEWLGPRGAIRRIVLALLPKGGDTHDPRMRPSAVTSPLRRAPGAGERVEEAVDQGPPVGMRNPPDERLRAFWRYPAGFYFQALSALILLLYGVLRSIEKLLPIGPLKDGALTRPIDNFVLDWFGDVYVLLNNPAEAASVRGRLLDSLNDLQAVGCDDITVIAHSGGVIVSYMTLVDESSEGLRVDRLITHGEAANLAWRLTAGEDGQNRGDAEVRFERLYRNLLHAPHRKELEWHDFWASKDPAPIGVLQIPKDRSISDDEDARTLARIRSHAVWNRLSLGDDHGSYWDNDEEFLVPVLRLLEDRGGHGLFGEEQADTEPSNKRRRRLSVLSLWLQTALLAPLAAVIAAYLAGTGTLERAGNAAADLWAHIPGSNLISDPVNAIRAAAWEDTDVGRFIAEAGLWVIVVVLFLATLYSVIAPPERPIPWAGTRGWRTVVRRFLEFAPWIALVVIGLALGAAANRFISGSTNTALDVGVVLGRFVLVVVVGLVIVWAVVGRSLGSGAESHGARRIAGDAFDFASTILVLAVAAVLVVSPFVAVAVYADVGRDVLGILVVIITFQVLGKIGAWRWAVWDQRERMAARTGRSYPGIGRVVTQIVLLTATVVALVVGVISNADTALLTAAVLAAVTVLLGVAVDVLDAARLERRAPTQALLHQARMRRS